jgi:putative peptidoglycan lipid II flippase
MNLLRAASSVSLFTLASRISGLGRDILVASLFGAGASADAFNVAFRIPNLLRRLFGEGAFAQAFVPVLAATRALEGDEVTHRLIDAVATVLFWALLVTCVLGVVAAPVVVWTMGSELEQFDSAVVMTRWMFPYIGFISLVSLCSGVLNTWKRFAVPAATPVLLNLAVIGAGWLLAPVFQRSGVEPIYSLAVGVMIGGVLQLALQVPALLRIGQLPRIGLRWGAIRDAWSHPGVKRVLRQMGPALIGVSVAPLSMIINTQIATRQGVGAVSWLTYADRLMEFPTALLGVALGVVLIPQLSAAQARNDVPVYAGLLDWGLRLALLLALPCSVALLVFPDALLATLFHRGAFTAEAVRQSALALMGYGAGLLGIIGVKILAPGFYARQDMRTPVRIALTVLVLTQCLNLVFVPYLRHAGLTLSIGLGAVVNAAWLFVGLRRAGWYTPAPGWLGFGLRVLVAAALLGGLLGWGAHAFDWVALGAHEGRRIGLMAAFLGGAALLYFAALAAMGIRLRHFMRRG